MSRAHLVESRFILPLEKGNGVDWEYFEFSPVCNVHFTPLGDGNSQVVLVVCLRP